MAKKAKVTSNIGKLSQRTVSKNSVIKSVTKELLSRG